MPARFRTHEHDRDTRRNARGVSARVPGSLRCGARPNGLGRRMHIGAAREHRRG